MNAEQDQVHMVNKHRDDLTGEYIFGDLIQFIFVIVFMVVWILDVFFLHFSAVTSIFPFWLHLLLAVMVWSGAFFIARNGLHIVFGTLHEKPLVIDYGVFKWVRHPIYLSAILFYFGFIIFKLSLAAIGIWFATIIMYYFLCRFEEKLLITRFGKEYENYMNKTPMLLPRVFK